MRVLVLNGSPKRDKSDTMCITRAFLQGVCEVADAQIEVINTVDLHVEYCRGCFACTRTNGKCVICDDMESILNKILSSDVLLLNYPLYCYGMPASLKAVIDRILPLSKMEMVRAGDRYEHVCKADYSKLRYVMVCGCGFPNSKHNFEPAVAQFGLLFPQNRTVITVPESPMFNVAEAQEVTAPRLELVRQAGVQFASKGVVDGALLEQICSPMIPEDVYAQIASASNK